MNPEGGARRGTSRIARIAAVPAILLLSAAFNAFLALPAYEANLGATGAPEATHTTGLRALILAAALVTIARMRTRIAADALGLALLAAIPFGLAIGLLYGNPPAAIGRHLFAAAFMFVLLVAGYNLRVDSDRFASVLRIASRVTLLAFAVAFALLLPQMTQSQGQVQLSSGPLLLPLTWGLFAGSPLMAAGSLLLIGLSNKRGVILAAVVVLALWAALAARRRSRTKINVLFIAAPAAIAGVAAVLALVHLAQGWREAFPMLEGTIERVSRFLDTESSVTALSSARNEEFKAVMTALATVPVPAMGPATGAGFGAEYEVQYYSHFLDEVQEYENTQPDVMFSYFVLLHGWLLGALIPLLLVARILAGLGQLRGAGPAAVPSAFLAGFLVDMSLSFVPNNPLFWLLLGHSLRAGRLPQAAPAAERRGEGLPGRGKPSREGRGPRST